MGSAEPLPRVPDLKALVQSPLTIPRATVAAFSEGEPGLSRIEQTIRDLADERGGKFSKLNSYYVPFEIPPVFWEYRCETCRFYSAVTDEVGECEVVGIEGDPLGGETISSQAYCAWWMPREGDEPFDWLRRRAGQLDINP